MPVSTPGNGITHITAAWHLLPLCKRGEGGSVHRPPTQLTAGGGPGETEAGGARGPTHLTEVHGRPLVVRPCRYLSSVSSASAAELNTDVRPNS